MRSEIAKRIYNETPDEVKNEVRDQAWRAFYESIPLTPEEEKEAIFQGKIKKYFYEKHKDYWQEKEGMAPSKSNAPTIQTISNVVEERSSTVGNTSYKAEK